MVWGRERTIFTVHDAGRFHGGWTGMSASLWRCISGTALSAVALTLQITQNLTQITSSLVCLPSSIAVRELGWELLYTCGWHICFNWMRPHWQPAHYWVSVAWSPLVSISTKTSTPLLHSFVECAQVLSVTTR